MPPKDDQPTPRARARNMPAHGGNGDFIPTLRGAERQAEVIRRRQRGQTYEEIGAALGVTKQSAYDMFRRGMRQAPREAVEEARELLFRAMEEHHTMLYAVAADPGPTVTSRGDVLHDVPEKKNIISAVREAQAVSADMARFFGFRSAPADPLRQSEIEAQIRDTKKRWEYELYSYQVLAIRAGRPVTPEPSGWEAPEPAIEAADDDDVVDGEVVDG